MRSAEPEVSLFFIHNKSEILAELRRSMREGSILGILSDTLGHGMFMCRIREVQEDEDEGDVMIVLHAEGLHRGSADGQVVYLNEIGRIYSFPVLERKENPV